MNKYFDTLTHVTHDGRWYDTSHDASASRLLKECERARVNKALVVGMPGSTPDYTLHIAKEYPETFFAIAGFNPTKYKGRSEVEEKICSLKLAGFRGIKIHPRFARHQPDSKEVMWALEACGAMGMLVLMCTMWAPPMPVMQKDIRSAVHTLCEGSCGAQLIMLHGCGASLLQAADIMVKYPNVLVDLSYTIVRYAETSLAQDIRFMMGNYDRKVVLGSDFPEYTFSDVLNVLDQHYGCIDQGRMNNIMYKNMSGVLEKLSSTVD